MMMVEWKVETIGKKNSVWGTTSVSTQEELQQAVAELWRQFFSMFRSVPPQPGLSVLGALQPWHGTLGLVGAINLEVARQFSGPTLYFAERHDQIESERMTVTICPNRQERSPDTPQTDHVFTANG